MSVWGWLLLAAEVAAWWTGTAAVLAAAYSAVRTREKRNHR